MNEVQLILVNISYYNNLQPVESVLNSIKLTLKKIIHKYTYNQNLCVYTMYRSVCLSKHSRVKVFSLNTIKTLKSAHPDS